MGHAPEPQMAIAEVVRHWSQLKDLAKFAVCRHGFGDSDGGFGLNYPGDLDESDRETIPLGSVLLYGFWGLPDGWELLVPESLYLLTLGEIFAGAGLHAEAASVRAAAQQRSSVREELG